jgi:hypothetical protein
MAPPFSPMTEQAQATAGRGYRASRGPVQRERERRGGLLAAARRGDPELLRPGVGSRAPGGGTHFPGGRAAALVSGVHPLAGDGSSRRRRRQIPNRISNGLDCFFIFI